MSEVGPWVRAALPAVLLFTVTASAALALSVAADFAPAPGSVRVIATMLVAVALGLAATHQVRAALAAWRHAESPATGAHRRRGRLATLTTTLATAKPAGPTASPASGGLRDDVIGDESRTDTGVFTGQTRAVPSTADLWGSADSQRERKLTPEAKPAPAPDARPARPALPKTGRPSWLRIAVVAASVAVLVTALWIQPEPIGQPATATARFLFGYLTVALPLLPLALLWPLPREAREPFPWRLVPVPLRDRRLWTVRELAEAGSAVAGWLRERVFTRATGVLLGVLGLLHLLRGAPDIGAGTARAGGLFGFIVAEPPRLALSAAGALGILVAVLVCAGVVIAAHAGRAFGTTMGYAALAVTLIAPLGGAVGAHWFGYQYYLSIAESRVVVVAGLSPGHRQAAYDAGVSADGLSPSLRDLFASGLPVADRDDGNRIAKALAQPSGSAAETFVGDQYELKVGECFDFIGGSSQLRYLAPCNGNHIGEVYFVGHLPFRVNPGKAAVETAARAMCEQSYGDYLGVPFGQSYLPMEAPLTPPTLDGDGWTERPVIACWLGSVGPWPLKATKTVAALQQKAPWQPNAGCKVEVPDTLRITAEAASTRCLAPGPERKLAAGGVSYLIDLEFGPVGRPAGAVRVGAACIDGAGGADGYSFEVVPDGSIEIWKHLGTEHTRMVVSGKPRGVGVPATTATPMQVTCKVLPQGVELAVTSTGNRKASALDETNPITNLSPRLLFVAAEAAPTTLNVIVFNAIRL